MRTFSTEEQNVVMQTITDANYFLGHIRELGSDEEWKNIILIKKNISDQLSHVKGEISEAVCMQQTKEFWGERQSHYDEYSQKYPGAL